MAFGFDDFSKLFDPISDILGTSGRQGVGLLQQEPEDLQRAAMIAALIASGGSAAGLFGAAPAAAAGETAALTLAPEAAGILGATETAALTPEIATLGADAATNAGIDSLYANSADIANQFTLDPTLQASLEGQGTQTAGLGNLLETGYWEEPVNLNAPNMEEMGYKGINQYTGKPIVEGTSLNPFPGGTENLMSKTAAHAPLDANALDYSSQIGYEQANSPALQDYQRTQLENELAARSAAAPPSNVQHFDNVASTTQNMRGGNPAEAGFQPPQVTRGGYFNNGISGEYTDTLTPFERGMDTAGRYFDKAADYVEKNPYKSAGLAYYGAYKTGMLDQPKQEPIADNYKNPYSMAGFRRSSPNPSAYQYRPRYAEGGIAGYAKGGRSKAESAMDFYDAMNPQQEAPPLRHGDPGIYYDMDPDTRYLDPMEAAMVRMSKLNSRTNVQAPTMAPSRRMGELDFKPVAAAQGGIMGYAAGGDVPVEDDEFNRLTGRGGPRTKEDPSEKFNLQNTAIYSSDHPLMSLPGRYLTSPVSTLGAVLNLVNPEGAKAANAAFNGINPEAVARQEAQPARQAENIRGLEAAYGPGSGGDAPPGPSASEQAANRADVGQSGLAQGGGIMGYNLGGYAAGGNPRLLRGPGDGMSDHIPATINNRQPARLADGEYVITADVVSHLGNGSTEAGARQLDAMMKRIRKGRTGTPKQGKQINPRKYLPA